MTVSKMIKISEYLFFSLFWCCSGGWRKRKRIKREDENLYFCVKFLSNVCGLLLNELEWSKSNRLLALSMAKVLSWLSSWRHFSLILIRITQSLGKIPIIVRFYGKLRLCDRMRRDTWDIWWHLIVFQIINDSFWALRYSCASPWPTEFFPSIPSS